MKLLKPQWFFGISTIQHIREISLRAKAKKIDPWQLYEPVIKNTKVYPEYPVLNLQLDSMDFVPLERFHSYARKKALQFKFKVIDRYALVLVLVTIDCKNLSKRLSRDLVHSIPCLYLK